MQALRYWFLPLFLFSQTLLAQSIVLKDAREAPTKIAIQNFLKGNESTDSSKLSIDLETELTADLIYSRIFKVLPSEAFLEPAVVGPIQTLKVDPWRQIGAQYVVRGKVSKEGSQSTLEGYVFEVTSGKLSLQKTYKTKRNDTEILAHQFGDDIVEIVTGKKGLFSTKIAFVYSPPNQKIKKIKEIWTMDFNGRNAKPLVQNGRTNLSPRWSVDGRFIYYVSSSVIDWHIWKADLNGRATQVTKFAGSALGPRPLNNGRELVISSSKDGNTDLYLIGTDGKEKKRLTKTRGINVAASLSPDGKHICFSTDRWGNLHIATLNLDSLEVTRLSRVGTLNDTCAWNPNENLVLFSGMDTDREFDIFAMDDQGNNMERLTYDAKKNEAPSWSPDGKLVTFSSERTNRNQVYVMKADGTEVRLLLELPGETSQPSWSPRLGY